MHANFAEKLKCFKGNTNLDIKGNKQTGNN